MQMTEIETDDTLRSMLDYGTQEFPIACYMDKISNRENRHIVWHWHRAFEFSYAVDGIVRCFVDDECITLLPGDALFINSELIHHFEGEESCMYNIIFSPEFIACEASAVFKKMVEPYLHSEYKYLFFSKMDCKYAEILKKIEEIGMLSRKMVCNGELKLYSKVISMWADFFALTQEGLVPRKRNSDMMRQARLREMMQYIQSNYSCRISLNEIAKQANVSVSEALRCFKTGLKTTPIHYLIDYRLEIAFSMLTTTRSTVHYIAKQVGFENESYFCRKFKKRYGCSPMRIRKQGIT